MRGINRRDLVAGVVIVFLLGLLVGNRFLPNRGAPAARSEPTRTATEVLPADVAQLQSLGDSFAAIATAATPAVVNVNTTAVIPGRRVEDPWLSMFFDRPDQPFESLGSGVIVDPEGIVITNNHVVSGEGATNVKVSVSLPNGKAFPARIVGTDPDSDLAVLQIEGKDLPFVEWGTAADTRVGDWVVAIGNPYGLTSTVTSGIISAKGRRDLGVSQFDDFLQTDAAINEGNSGGALLNLQGRLIGINTAIFSKSGGSQGLGFAIPADIAKANAEQILSVGKVVRGWIGVRSRPLNVPLAQELSLPNTDGALLLQFYEGFPALAVGLRQGDVVTAVGSTLVKDPNDLRTAIAAIRPGTATKLTVWRDGRSRQVTISPVQRPVRADGQPEPGT